MRLTVLGCHSPLPGPGQACPGYLLEAGEDKILLDCGSGVVSRLQQFISYETLSAVVLSHLHGDHAADLAVLKYGIDLALQRGKRKSPLTVFAPPEPKEDFYRLAYKDALQPKPLIAGEAITVGGFTLSFYQTLHALPNLAMRIEREGKTLVYTGDTGWDEGLIAFACHADLLLVEATLLEPGSNLSGHLTAQAAGELAKAAGVQQVMLTHLWYEFSREDIAWEGQKGFGRDVLVAAEGMVFLM